ncbi:unnamed protein product [Blepharisma stoltei]|uniref:Tetratricopeptide repeat protein n=1 Tax=Blepharisma stoltei TaxID=1481888 RepID=A0AAU9JDE9_9CILI|nr:unnamed protein product [Blepharisma stoltei]
MNKVSCSLDSFDAIFISSCGHFACPKHYFYYKSQGFELERIKISVNNKSKEILINFILAVREKFTFYSNDLINPKNQSDSEEYISRLKTITEAYNYCNRILLLLARKQFVSTKLILSPFEYFLIEPPCKAKKYVNNFRYSEDLIHFYKSFKTYVFDFNYFKFEDQRYIHGFEHKTSYYKSHISSFCYILFSNFIQISEYEMAYELIQSLLSYKELYYHPLIEKTLSICEEFCNILKKFIKKEDYNKLLEQWEALDISSYQTSESTLKNSLIRILSAIFRNESKNSCLFNFLLRVKNFCWNFGYKYDAIILNQELGWLHYNNKNYNKAKIYFMKSINYHKELKKSEFSKLLFDPYRGLAMTYKSLNKTKKVKKILEIIEKEEVNFLNKNKFKFYATIAEIDYLLNSYEKAIKKIWMCIKLSKQNEFNSSDELSGLYLYLGKIYTLKGDFKRAHIYFHNANSLIGILSSGDPKVKEIYKAMGVFYLNSQWYKDALMCFEYAANNSLGHELLFLKFSIGIAYFWMFNYERAIECLIWVQEQMLYFEEIYKSELFIVNAYIGELCYLIGWDKYAIYFAEAIKFIDYYDANQIDIFFKSSNFVFDYFYWIFQYEKCEIILSKINEILINCEYLKFRRPYYLIKLAELYIAYNKIEQAEKYLGEAEILLIIDKILLCPQKNIKINDLDCISDYIELAKIYINLFNTFPKAEKILKYAEEVVSTKRCNDRFSKLAIYNLLGALYFKEQRWEESRHYIQLSLDLHKEFNHNSDIYGSKFQ